MLVYEIVACSFVAPPAVLVFHNRSDVPIALYPEVTIGPCSMTELDEAAIARGKARLEEAFASSGDFESWVPAGAIQFQSGVPVRRVGESDPITVVVSAVAQPRFVEGRVPASELPECGGQPLGISQGV